MASNTAAFRLSVPPKVTGTHTAITAVATAHPPAASTQSDLFQVINQSGKIVWSLDFQGVVHINPASPSKDALLGKFFGSSFAAAGLTPASVDFLQIHDGSSVVYHVDSNGNAHTP